jgi:imidazole glycerol-phosphate synthase subunit HisF
MLKRRLISCLIARDRTIVQSIGFKRYLPVGSVAVTVEFMKDWDIDEIVLLDTTAARRGREPDLETIEEVSRRCFVPITFGGGIRTVDHIRSVIRAGADKVSINAAALADPSFITEGARYFGSQCVVVSIDARRGPGGGYEVYADGGKRATGLDAVAWAREAEQRGAGEIFLTSIDRDGSKQGYDLELVRAVSEAVRIPVIACGGVGRMEHFVEGLRDGKAAAVAAGNIFHHLEHSTIVAKAYLKNAGLGIRLSTLADYQGFSFDSAGRILKRPDAELEKLWLEKHKAEAI